ncbi:unnamed protein product [Symbiodinium pilosum]|uniref:Uncharacterized protein n=1 Tax=Symbiodinium pilosum TaxID=2952 RepID=A0A812S5P4_SYMPI|nr:unnamed protein product [Symbiodinium pilosum]
MPRNQTFCPISDENLAEVLCAVDEDCVCANSSHIRELANVTVDGLACYACEPRRPPACTEANDQCTPEACECGNPLTHVKRDATTVDGSPCHYCEPIGGMGSIGRPEFFIVVMLLALVVMWQLLGRKPVPGKSSLRLSRRQGDRNRAIKVQQEPLRFYEEVLFMIGDFFDFLVDGAWEILAMAWNLLQRIAACLSSASPMKTVNAVRAFIRPVKDDLDWEHTETEAKRLRRRSEATADAAGPVQRASAQKAQARPDAKAPERKPPSISKALETSQEVKAQAKKPEKPEKPEKLEKATEKEAKARRKQAETRDARTPCPVQKVAAPAAPAAAPPREAKAKDGARRPGSRQASKLSPLDAKDSKEVPQVPKEKDQGKQAEHKVDCQEVAAEKCTSSARTGVQSDLPRDVHELPSPSPLYKAAIAVIKASAVAAAVEIEAKCFVQSTALEESEGSTEGGNAPNEDEIAQSESEDCDNRGSLRPNTAAAAAAILAAATDKRAAALELLDAAAMPTIEVRTFLSELDIEAPVMRRTVSDSDLALYC